MSPLLNKSLFNDRKTNRKFELTLPRAWLNCSHQIANHPETVGRSNFSCIWAPQDHPITGRCHRRRGSWFTTVPEFCSRVPSIRRGGNCGALGAPQIVGTADGGKHKTSGVHKSKQNHTPRGRSGPARASLSLLVRSRWKRMGIVFYVGNSVGKQKVRPHLVQLCRQWEQYYALVFSFHFFLRACNGVGGPGWMLTNGRNAREHHKVDLQTKKAPFLSAQKKKNKKGYGKSWTARAIVCG